MCSLTVGRRRCCLSSLAGGPRGGRNRAQSTWSGAACSCLTLLRSHAYLCPLHGLCHVEPADVPAAQHKVIGVNHGQQRLEGREHLLTLIVTHTQRGSLRVWREAAAAAATGEHARPMSRNAQRPSGLYSAVCWACRWRLCAIGPLLLLRRRRRWLRLLMLCLQGPSLCA